MKPSIALAVLAACGPATVFAKVQRLRSLAAAASQRWQNPGLKSVDLVTGRIPVGPSGRIVANTYADGEAF